MKMEEGMKLSREIGKKLHALQKRWAAVQQDYSAHLQLHAAACANGNKEGEADAREKVKNLLDMMLDVCWEQSEYQRQLDNLIQDVDD